MKLLQHDVIGNEVSVTLKMKEGISEYMHVLVLVKITIMLSAKAPQYPTASFNQLNVPRFLHMCLCVCVQFCLPLPFFVFHLSVKRWRFIEDRTRPVMTVPFMSPGERK